MLDLFHHYFIFLLNFSPSSILHVVTSIPSSLQLGSDFVFKVKVRRRRGCRRWAEGLLEGSNLPERRRGGRGGGKRKRHRGMWKQRKKKMMEINAHKITCCVCFLQFVEEDLNMAAAAGVWSLFCQKTVFNLLNSTDAPLPPPHRLSWHWLQ